MTGSTHKKISINLDNSETSSFQACVVHSRYSSASKVYERNKPRKVASPTWEMRSAYPLRGNIWEYLNEDKKARKFNCSSKRRTRPRCKQTEGKDVENKMWLIFMLVLAGIIILTYSRLSDFIAQSKFITKVIPRTRLISLLNTETSVKEECCYMMKTLSASLLRAERALRNTQRIRRLMIVTSRTSTSDAVSSHYEREFIQEATVVRGSGTKEWGSRVALWGVLPLWRVSPPPSTVLATRTPVPSDCWPFSGYRGEMVIELKQETEVHSISIEHVRPDTAKSALKNFAFYGILDNGTFVTCIEAEYRNQGPAKQYFKFTSINTPLQKMILRVLSNQGNPKYTCVYRIHLYGNGTKPT